MFSRTIGFTRWYDSVPELAQAVRQMEKIPAVQQRAICQVILDSVDMHAVRYKNDPSLKKLGTEKILGLMKSKTKRRWYDQDPIVHQAFNLLYMMDEMSRREMGLKVLFSIKVMEQALGKTKDYGMAGRYSMDLQGVVKAVFTKPVDYLASRTTVVPKTELAEEQIPVVLKSAPEPVATPPTEREDSHLGHSEGGMKIIRLKKAQARSTG